MSRMPFREKLKKAFKSSSPASSKNPSPTIVQAETTRWPSNVYRPDEPMPRPKYRAPVKKEHKEKLEAFNFASSWRRRSHVSLYSPMGSRLPSRRGSRANRDSLEARRKSIVQQGSKTGSTSRSNSIASSYDPKPRPTQRAAQPTSLQPEPEQYGDDDVGNGMFTSTVAFFVPPRKAQLVYHASTHGKSRPASALVLPTHTRPQMINLKPQQFQMPARVPLASPREEEIDPMDTDDHIVTNTARLQACKKLPSPKRIAVRPVSTSWVS
ncbi:hypothetical protein K461DRAFT_64379 [Myriangium duriaei CBS 260.36]|uniref:Uncharacterized protein n=1 Tax=Myriangium duriaei CBS 260.36 TaxID=1168546 RepID=A0A9P4MI26_9PEZI|nr:hypothetical protein K461DRAFT_64379 [Myriangium duriaei CBS 260.36]